MGAKTILIRALQEVEQRSEEIHDEAAELDSPKLSNMAMGVGNVARKALHEAARADQENTNDWAADHQAGGE